MKGKNISRPHRITVRFTDMEYGLITDAAEETGFTLSRYFHTGGIHSKAMQDEIQSCISELWNLRKDVTRMAGDFHGSVETYRNL